MKRRYSSDTTTTAPAWPPPGGPAKPENYPGSLACCDCGRATAPEDGEHREGIGWLYGWPGRLCRRCATIRDGAPGPTERAAQRLSDALGEPVPADEPDLLDVARGHLTLYSGAPLTTAFDPGSPGRWEHLDLGMIRGQLHAGRARRIAATIPRAAPSKRGCAACGVATCTLWRPFFDRRGERRHLCVNCAGHLRATGDVVGDDWMDRLASQAAGLGGRVGGLAGRINLPLYADRHPHGSGTPTSWGWLGESLVDLRRYARRTWPDKISDPGERALALAARADRLRAAQGRQPAGMLTIPRGGAR